MAMLRLLGARGARGSHGAANEAFTASAERALMYSKLHRSSAHAPALEACARSLAIIESSEAAGACEQTARHRRHLLGAVANTLRSLGEADVAKAYCDALASPRRAATPTAAGKAAPHVPRGHAVPAAPPARRARPGATWTFAFDPATK